MTLPPFAERLRARLHRRRLLPRGEHVLAAVSGGADSVALLRALELLAPRLGLRLSVAHLNHGIRGAAAALDGAFVRDLAARLGLPFFPGRSNVPRLAAHRGISIEMAAREARYRFLARTARRIGAQVVVTAHTADDQAETLLLRIARGAGLRGLAGIAESTVAHRVRVARPLLHATRKDVEQFLRDLGQAWQQDETNADRTHLRNRVRHDVLPLLADVLNPRIREALSRLAEIAAEEDEWAEAQAKEIAAICIRPRGKLHIRTLLDQPPAARRRVLMRWLRDQGVPPDRLGMEEIERLGDFLSSQPSAAALELPGGFLAKRREGSAVIARAPSAGPLPLRTHRLRIPGVTPIPEAGLAVTVRVAPGLVRQSHGKPGRFPAVASLAPDALGGRRLTVRAWKPGDVISPLGMRGSRKLQDIFVDAKLDPARRHRVPVVCAGEEIVWLPGYRVAKGWDVRDASRPALQIGIRNARTPVTT